MRRKRRGGRPGGPRRPDGRGTGNSGQSGSKSSNGHDRGNRGAGRSNGGPATEVSGIFEEIGRGGGYLRHLDHGYTPRSTDPEVSADLARRIGLRPGDEVAGTADGGRGNRGPLLRTIATVNGGSPEDIGRRPDFSKLRAVAPRERLVLTHPDLNLTSRQITMVIDVLCPFGLGQRALVVAPAKAGKTTVLQAIAKGIAANRPAAKLFILLVDERPEEVTELEMMEVGEVVASSFDCPAEQHVQLAELTLERARRVVESGGEAVIVLDSLTRLARAHNSVERGSGRTLTGGLGAEAMERPKRFFGSARAVDPAQGGGSLTIIATALIDTGSRMDQVIFEEFKGTGNSELVLSRELAERRIWPAIDIAASGTRREELILPAELLAMAVDLRKRYAGLPIMQATPAMLQELELPTR